MYTAGMESLLFAFGIGVVSGLRAFTSLAALMLVRGGLPGIVLAVVAVGEYIADASPKIPSRTMLPSIVVRPVSGAIAGWLIAAPHGGSPAIGAIVPGFQADLVMLDLDTLAFTPLNDLRRQLVYCESGSSVRMTMVAGRIVYQEGKLCTLDEAALRREARAHAQRLATAQASAAAAAGEWLPYYREMYLKAAGRNVGMQRRASGAQ